MDRHDREVRLVGREFDPDYYSAEYPDVILNKNLLLEHFCSSGWAEGRNPNAYFDTTSYIMANGDVSEAGINPFYHYLAYGISEGRPAVPSATPSVRTQLLFGYSVIDWVTRVRPYLDSVYYGAYLSLPLLEKIDLAAHFAYRGWREGMSPNREFVVRDWVSHYPDTKRFLVNPLILRLELEAGSFRPVTRVVNVAASGPAPEPAPVPVSELANAPAPVVQKDEQPVKTTLVPDDHIELIRTEFSAAYYLSQNPDVAAAEIDPLMHYVLEGWKEGRNPNKEFDTAYYMLANEDVVAAGLHPFWHYLAEGRNEGRRPCRPGGHRRRTIDAARPPERRTDGYVLPENEARFEIGHANRVRAALRKAGSGVVLSLSHDCYIRSVGGTQIFISDEQQKFNRAGYAYLHLSPMIPRLALAPRVDRFEVRVVLDGEFMGVAAIAAVADLLTGRGQSRGGREMMVVHSLLGFNAEVVSALHTALEPSDSFYWLHDYSSLCAGFNLLRNDLEFCNAPPPDSMVCRVCVCGPGRPGHLREMEEIFDRCHFTVLAPSQFTLDLWRAKTRLRHAASRVHWHWLLKELPAPRQKRPRRVGAKQRLTVAFVGFPLPSKGWSAFSALVDRLLGDERYRFLHFVAPGTTTLPEVETVSTEVTSSDREATVKLLRKHAVDVVLVLSTWPETFSFVAHEALVAGCSIVCMADSGNVAVLVAKTGRGSVVKDEAELLAYFEGDRAMRMVRELSLQNLPALEIIDAGTTATAIEALCAAE